VVIAGLCGGSRIVETWTDSTCQTGESKYRTEDGRVWKTNFGGTEPRTGVDYARIKGDRMVPQYPDYPKREPPPPEPNGRRRW
jgi:hypothetical protein